MLINLKKIFDNNVYLEDPKMVWQFILTILRHLQAEDPEALEVEHTYVIGVNSRNRVLYVDETCRGTDDAAIMTPRSIYRQALVKKVKSIFVCHNHPSACLKPSEDDIRLTKRLEQSGELLGVKLLDHVIVADPTNCDTVRDGHADNAFYSFASHQLL
jgi:DNA repair protein RadC